MFEFETKEQREAWPIIRDILKNTFPLGESHAHMQHRLDMAASRFDAREKTCGIEPLSEEHFALGACCGMCDYFGADEHAIMYRLYRKGLLTRNAIDAKIYGARSSAFHANDRGREVLANLNAMCKVER